MTRENEVNEVKEEDMENYFEKNLMYDFIEPVWKKNWLRTNKFVHVCIEDFNNSEGLCFTVEDMRALLIKVDSLVGYRLDDQLNHDLEKRFIFRSKNLVYPYFLRCRYVHRIITKEYSKYLNLNAELDPNMEIDVNRIPIFFLHWVLQFPPLDQD